MKQAILTISSTILSIVEKEATARMVSEILLEGMHRGIVEFEFTKRDGTTRHAFGTRLPNLIKDHVVGGEGPSGVISFWDVELGEWRSVRPNTVTKIW